MYCIVPFSYCWSHGLIHSCLFFLPAWSNVQDVGTFMKTVVSTQISCLYIVDAWFLNGYLSPLPHPWLVVDQSIVKAYWLPIVDMALSSLELEQSGTGIKSFCRPDLQARSVRGAEMCKETWWGSAIVDLQLDHFTHWISGEGIRKKCKGTQCDKGVEFIGVFSSSVC